MIVIDLPMPPSTNRIWVPVRGRLVKSARYRTWIKAADGYFLMVKRKLRPVRGPFRARIILDERYAYRKTSDNDNRSKAALDYLQRAGLIDNDKLSVRTTTEWGHAPLGCRIEIEPAGEPS